MASFSSNEGDINFRKIHQAAEFAAQVHKGAVRKGAEGVSYIVHPLEVALLMAHAGASEEVIIAAILHDVVEDCEPYGSVTIEQLDELFGSAVARLVAAVTEDDKSLPWLDRKLQALEAIKQMDEDEMLLDAGDAMNNLISLVAKLESEGMAAFEVFNAPAEQIVWRYSEMIKLFAQQWPENPLLDSLYALLGDVVQFIEYDGQNPPLTIG